MEDWMFIWVIVGFIAFMGWMMMGSSSNQSSKGYKIDSPSPSSSEPTRNSPAEESKANFNINFDESQTKIPCYLFISCTLGFDDQETKKTIEDLAWMVTDKEGGYVESYSLKGSDVDNISLIHKELTVAAKSCKAVANTMLNGIYPR